MRIIAVKTLKLFSEKHKTAKQPLLAWFKEATDADWRNNNALKEQFGNASIISDKRVVFNIHGNSFRLIVDIEYRLQIIFIVWLGTHKEYDNINAKSITYVKAG